MVELRLDADWIRCLSLNIDEKVRISGCVSAKIMGHDTATERLLFSILDQVHNQPLQLSTINALAFSSQSPSVFLSGSRDGWLSFLEFVSCVQKIYQPNQ